MKTESWDTYFASALSVRYAAAVAKEHGGVNPALLIEQAAALADAASAFVAHRAQREAVPMARYSLDVNTSADILETLDPLGDWVKFSDIPQPVEVRPVSEPYGHVTTHSVTGQQFFYRHPARPYLDNAKECVAVYAAAQPVEVQPVAGWSFAGWFVNDAAQGEPPHWSQVSDDHANDADVLALGFEALCHVEIVSSRVCALGTKSCVTRHGAQPVAREPMSWDEVVKGADEHFMIGNPEQVCTFDKGVKYAERHHGIKPTSAEGGE